MCAFMGTFGNLSAFSVELPYRYKGVAYNQPPKKEAQKVDADHSTTHDNERTDEVPAT